MHSPNDSAHHAPRPLGLSIWFTPRRYFSNTAFLFTLSPFVVSLKK